MLKISATTIAHAIAHAREREAFSGSWDNHVEQAFHDEPGSAALDDFVTSWGGGELAEFISTLSEEERASLLAIAWIGQGTFAPEHLDDAIASARAEQSDYDYLLGLPLLAEYLRDGAEKLRCFPS